MILTGTIFSIGLFSAWALRRLKTDLEQERLFRERLQGRPLLDLK